MTQRLSGVRRIAWWISQVGHPLVLAAVTISFVAFRLLPPDTATKTSATFIAVTVVPLLVLILAGVRRGKWSDADVSVRQERRGFYPRALAVFVLSTIAMYVAGMPHFVIRGSVAATAMVAVAMLINFRLKVSLHAAFSFFAAVAVWLVSIPAGVVAFCAAVLICWSRVVLGRHSVVETIAGAALGMATGVVLRLLV